MPYKTPAQQPAFHTRGIKKLFNTSIVLVCWKTLLFFQRTVKSAMRSMFEQTNNKCQVSKPQQVVFMPIAHTGKSYVSLQQKFTMTNLHAGKTNKLNRLSTCHHLFLLSQPQFLSDSEVKIYGHGELDGIWVKEQSLLIQRGSNQESEWTHS